MTDRDSNKPLATSRRNFLKQSIALAGAGFAAQCSLGGRLRRAGKSRTDRRLHPTD